MKFILYCLVILAELSIDQYSKFVIVRDFSLHQSIEIIKDFFSITYVQNFGAGFSILQNAKIFLSVVSISVIVMLTYYFFENKKKDYLYKTAYLFYINSLFSYSQKNNK